MKNKHAYLIIAHNEFEILKILLSMLDDERNDIYLHFDKKVGNIDINIEELQLRNSKLFVLDERIDVRWGDLSLVKTELLLFEAAYNNGEKTQTNYLPENLAPNRWILSEKYKKSTQIWNNRVQINLGCFEMLRPDF